MGGCAVLLLIIQTGAAGADPYRYSYAQMYMQELILHPLRGEPVSIHLPFQAHGVQFSPDGRFLYAMEGRARAEAPQSLPGLLKVEFDPIRIKVLPGSDSLRIDSYLVSHDGSKIVIVGSHIGDPKPTCGVFELSLPSGDIRQALQACPHGDQLSLSRDRNRILANIGHPLERNTGMELIDLAKGTSTQIYKDWWQGAWSPDGKWIAAMTRDKHSRLVLLDPNDFSRRRDLGRGGDFPEWSPDSRYIQLWKKPWSNGLFCSFLSEPIPWTVDTVDVQTGRRKTIPSFRCFSGGAVGWADNFVVRQPVSPTAN